MSKLNLYGFNFSDLKDVEIYSIRQRMARAVFADFLRLGYDRDVCFQYLLRFVSGWLSINECVTLIKYRDNLLHDCGTPFPEYDSEEICDMFTIDTFEISLNPGKFVEIQFCEGNLPVSKLFDD